MMSMFTRVPGSLSSILKTNTARPEHNRRKDDPSVLVVPFGVSLPLVGSAFPLAAQENAFSVFPKGQHTLSHSQLR